MIAAHTHAIPLIICLVLAVLQAVTFVRHARLKASYRRLHEALGLLTDAVEVGDTRYRRMFDIVTEGLIAINPRQVRVPAGEPGSDAPSLGYTCDRCSVTGHKPGDCGLMGCEGEMLLRTDREELSDAEALAALNLPEFELVGEPEAPAVIARRRYDDAPDERGRRHADAPFDTGEHRRRFTDGR